MVLKTPWHQELRWKLCFCTKVRRLHVWSAVSTQTINLSLGWKNTHKINTTTSKILSCLSIDLHLTKDNLGVKMLRKERFTGEHLISAIRTVFKQRRGFLATWTPSPQQEVLQVSETTMVCDRCEWDKCITAGFSHPEKHSQWRDGWTTCDDRPLITLNWCFGSANVKTKQNKQKKKTAVHRTTF